MTHVPSKLPRLVVALGASAGGLDAFNDFFSGMPANSGMAFVLLPHLAPDHPSIMADLLSRDTDLTVKDIVHDSPIEPDHIYILPAGKQLSVSRRRLQLEPMSDHHDKWMIVDHFFVSLAAEFATRSVAIILSGTGSHGVLGFHDIKKAGGLVIAQQPDTAQFAQMPQSAIDSGLVDMVLAPKDMPKALLKYKKHPYLNEDFESKEQYSARELKAILGTLKAQVKYDFTGYRKNMVFRRIYRRMGIIGLDNLSQYNQYLQNTPEEVIALHKDLLIGVTTFFRDQEAFKLLEKKVLPDLIKNNQSDAPLRIWIPACSTGEEAYSIGILLIEQFERFKKPLNVQLFASDIDNEALQKARKGIYDDIALENICQERRRRFFTKTPGNKYQVNKKLRDLILFAAQNLIGDAPFSRLDLISCRNLLIYLQPELQQKVINLFHFALMPNSYLLLGPSESISKQTGMFEVISKKWRLYKKIGMTHHEAFTFQIEGQSARNTMSISNLEGEYVQPHSLSKFSGLLQRGLLDAYAPAAVLINRGYQILQFHGPTVNFLEFPKGSPTYDLMTLLRDGLRTRVRAAVQHAIEKNQSIVDQNARVKLNGHYKPCILTVRPLTESMGNDRAYLVTFEEKTFIELNEVVEPQSEVDSQAPGSMEKQQVIEQLEYELNSTRDDLRTTVLELERTNEDLKISNEEVMSMNEELQSANEELETSKEELQSMNEELNSVNVELLWKVEQLERSHNDVQNLLSSTDIATIFLDRDMHIQLFNPATKTLLNLHAKDKGRHISDFSAKVEENALVEDARLVLEKLAPIRREVHQQINNEAVKSYLRSIVPYRTSDNRVDGVVITFVEITKLHQQRRNLEELFETRNKQLKLEKDRVSSIMGAAFEGIIVMTAEGYITEFNRSAEATFSYSEAELLGSTVLKLIDDSEAAHFNSYLNKVVSRNLVERANRANDFVAMRKDGSTFPIQLNLSPVDNTGQIVATIREMTEQKALQKEVMDVVSYEQEKIGIELHDSLGQKLTGISLLAGNLKQRLSKDDDALVRGIDEIISQLRLSIGDIRNICHGLAPLSIMQEGLPYALKSLLETAKSAGHEVKFSVSDGFSVEDRAIAIQYYRIIQEALNNSMKHANAKQITLELSEHNNKPKMVFKDDGKGFDFNVDGSKKGIGLKVMQYRAFAIGAKFDIQSSPNGGTQICCQF